MVGLSRARGTALWVCALFALAVNVAVTIHNIVELIRNEREVDRAQETLSQVAQLTTYVNEAESGQRGYLIAFEERYLATYDQAAGRIESSLTRLKELTAEHPEQRDSLAQLAALIEERISILDIVITARNEAGLEVAAALVASGAGKDVMDRIRSIADEMAERERQRLASRKEVAASKYTATLLTTVVGGLLTVGITGLAFIVVRSELGRRQRVEADLRARGRQLQTVADELAIAHQHASETVLLLEAFLANSPVGFAYLDAQTRIVRLNEPFAGVTGLTMNAHVGRRLPDLVPFAQAAEDLRQVARDRKPIVDRVLLDPEVGSEQPRTWQATYFPVVGSEEQFLGFGVMVRDITLRLRNERILRDSQARFRSLAESMPQFVWVSRADGHVEYFNERWKDYTGLRPDESTGSRWLEVLHPDDRERTTQRWQQSVATGTSYEVEYRLRGRDGSYRWFLGRGLPQRDDQGRVVNWFGTSTDIHDRKLAEENLQRALQRFRLLTETLPQLVWVTSPAGEVEYVNKRWLMYAGVMPEQAREGGWWQAVHPDDRAAAAQHWSEALAGGQAYRDEFRVLQQADGQPRWFQIVALPLVQESGGVVQWIGSLTDIDDRKRRAQALEEQVRARTRELSEVNEALRAEIEVRKAAEEKEREAAEDLRRSNMELEQFAYVASHDLQEPLRKIQAFGDRLNLRFRDKLGDQGREYLERMITSATRMRRLINDLLTFSRVSTQAHPFEDVDVGEAARAAVSDLEERLEKAGGRVDIGPLPHVQGDALQLQQVFMNLIGNALKFHKSGVPPVVAVTGEVVTEGDLGRPRQVCRIEVKDNGIGFDQSYAERIFQIFQRLHGRGEFEGTGIGLAICRKIVERHQGRIFASSKDGEGATFTIVLPLKQAVSGESRF